MKLFFITLTLTLITVSGERLHDQTTLLLNLKTTLQYDTSSSTKLNTWNAPQADCCHWGGVKCDNLTSQVISLDLSSEGIKGGINKFSPLFDFLSLRSLNLAYNDFSEAFPSSSFQKLTQLTYLNLSNQVFLQRVPIDTLYIGSLEVLDLSVPGYYVCEGKLEKIVRNLSNLKELYLDGITFPNERKPWAEVLSSFVPNVQVLSMRSCNLTSEISSSLANLHALSVIHLDLNNFSSPVPEFLAAFRNLTVLSVSYSGLIGKVPQILFQNPTLTTLDLSGNELLQGSLPEFPLNASLQTLQLTFTNFSGVLPHSIGNINMLQTLHLGDCNFHGIIPPSIGRLSLLESIILSSNNFSGTIPSFSRMMNLKQMYLQNNSLNGVLTSTDWGGLHKLEIVDLSSNLLTGRIPVSLFSVPSMQEINLADNNLGAYLEEFISVPSSKLHSLDLSRNNLDGEVPKSIFLFKPLVHLDLSRNQFNGTLQLNKILSQLQNLLFLDLSYNGLSVNSGGTITSIVFPQMNFLYMASCNLQVVPEFLKNQSQLIDLDLSDNHIQGKVPNWIWKEANGIQVSYAGFRLLNLSCNAFSELEQPIPNIPGLTILDLHSNNLEGQVPVLPSRWELRYLDFSNNSFTSINPQIGETVSETIFFSLSRNKIHGNMPASLCNATALEVLLLDHNRLNGTIPACLVLMVRTLAVLNLRGNSLGGSIPDKFTKGCMLETLDLNGNILQGQIPRSLDSCEKLKVLDLGNNKLHDNFPCHLRSLSALKVLILRSNKFRGSVVCSESNAVWRLLQIVDLASNNFSGELAPYLLQNWKSMMTERNTDLSQLHYTENMVNVYYQDQVSVNYKGSKLDLQKIITIFTSIDLSDNAFSGVLPGELQSLTGLKGLNLTRNCFTGEIPSTIEKLEQLESLDLSFNAITGNIPQELTNLNFLQVLNLSFNKLTGEIPTGTQLQAREASSYMGNSGLCGPPLPLSCRIRDSSATTAPDEPQGSLDTVVDWVLTGAVVGFPVGMAVVIVSICYIDRLWHWMDRLAMIILNRQTKINKSIVKF